MDKSAQLQHRGVATFVSFVVLGCTTYIVRPRERNFEQKRMVLFPRDGGHHVWLRVEANTSRTQHTWWPVLRAFMPRCQKLDLALLSLSLHLPTRTVSFHLVIKTVPFHLPSSCQDHRPTLRCPLPFRNVTPLAPHHPLLPTKPTVADGHHALSS